MSQSSMTHPRDQCGPMMPTWSPVGGAHGVGDLADARERVVHHHGQLIAE